MAGYSGTPLVKKLGIKPGARVALVNAPDDFQATLGKLPDDVKFVNTKSLDLILFFVLSERILARDFAKLAERLISNGMIWIAWPKKSSRVATDLTFDRVQRIGALGHRDPHACRPQRIYKLNDSVIHDGVTFPN